MIEKIKNLDYTNISQDESNDILNEILKESDDNLKECLLVIIDSVKYDELESGNPENLSPFYNTVFSNEKIKKIMENLLNDYEKDLDE